MHLADLSIHWLGFANSKERAYTAGIKMILLATFEGIVIVVFSILIYSMIDECKMWKQLYILRDKNANDWFDRYMEMKPFLTARPRPKKKVKK